MWIWNEIGFFIWDYWTFTASLCSCLSCFEFQKCSTAKETRTPWLTCNTVLILHGVKLNLSVLCEGLYSWSVIQTHNDIQEPYRHQHMHRLQVRYSSHCMQAIPFYKLSNNIKHQLVSVYLIVILHVAFIIYQLSPITSKQQCNHVYYDYKSLALSEVQSQSVRQSNRSQEELN